MLCTFLYAISLALRPSYFLIKMGTGFPLSRPFQVPKLGLLLLFHLQLPLAVQELTVFWKVCPIGKGEIHREQLFKWEPSKVLGHRWASFTRGMEEAKYGSCKGLPVITTGLPAPLHRGACSLKCWGWSAVTDQQPSLHMGSFFFTLPFFGSQSFGY